MTAVTEVTALEAVLADARKREQQERRAELKNELRQLRADIREAVKKYDTMAASILAERRLRTLLQERIEYVQEQISKSLAVRPPAVAFLGNDDPECAQWMRTHSELERQRDQLIAQRNEVPQIDVIEALRLKNGIIALQHREINILNSLDGSIGKSTEGGLSASRP